jgi:hypothetical protein
LSESPSKDVVIYEKPKVRRVAGPEKINSMLEHKRLELFNRYVASRNPGSSSPQRNRRLKRFPFSAEKSPESFRGERLGAFNNEHFKKIN